MKKSKNNNGIFTNIYTSILCFDEVDRDSKLGDIFIKHYKRKLLKIAKKIKTIPLSIPVLDDLVIFSIITDMFNCNEDTEIKRITIKESNEWEKIDIKFNMNTAKIELTSFYKSNIGNRQKRKRRTESYTYEITESNDMDLNNIIKHIRDTVYNAISDYIKRS